MLFDRMFAGTDAEATASEVAKRGALRTSVLDTVVDRIDALHRRLDAADRAKLDQYATAVRELENRIAALSDLACEVPTAPLANLPLADRIAAATDLLVVALQCDFTRVATFMAGPTSALTTFPDLGSTKAHHTLSHDYLYRSEDADAFRQIQRWQIEQWGTFVAKLAAASDGEGDLLSSTLTALVTEFGEPSAHHAAPLPALIAGGEAGGVVQGAHRRAGGAPPQRAVAGDDSRSWEWSRRGSVSTRARRSTSVDRQI